MLEQSLPHAGGMQIVDLDGDGKNEIVVTRYEANSVFVDRRKQPSCEDGVARRGEA